MAQSAETYNQHSDDVPPRFRGFSDGEWHYIFRDNADSCVLDRFPDHEYGEDWLLSFQSEFSKGDSPFLGIQMPSAVVRELYDEIKNVPAEEHAIADQAKCEYCGESVSYKRAVPNERYSPVHRRCYVEVNDAVERLK